MEKLLYFLEERVPQNLRKLVIKYIEAEKLEYRICFYSEPSEDIAAKLRWCDAVLFAPGRYLSTNLMENAKHVRLMQLWSSGYDKFNLDDARRLSIPVANNGGANAISVAEHTIMLMLAAARRLPEGHVRTTRGIWAGNSHGMDMVMLYGKKLGLIGMGNIGQQVARRAAAFGMEILYNDPRRLNPDIERELNSTYCSMENLLPNADFLSLHLHLNRSTDRIIGIRELDLLKKNCVLINVSRSQLVDLEALVPRLRDGSVLAAGFDVYEEEPTTGYESYLSLPNVVATPHTAGSTFDTYHMSLSNCMRNIACALRGEAPSWILN